MASSPLERAIAKLSADVAFLRQQLNQLWARKGTAVNPTNTQRWVKLAAAMHHDKATATIGHPIDADDVEDTGTNLDIYSGRFFGFWPDDHVMKVEKFNDQWVPVYPGFQSVAGDLDGSIGDDDSTNLVVDGVTLTVYTRADWIASGTIADEAEVTASLAQDGNWYLTTAPCPA